MGTCGQELGDLIYLWQWATYSWQTVSCELPFPAYSSPPKGLGETPFKGLPMKAQVLKDITSGRQEDHSTGQPGKVVGVRTQTYGISSVKRGEGHDQHFVLERDLGREFLICASTAW